jgi:two-component system, chemotaxis family, chemotaxis protein CheY
MRILAIDDTKSLRDLLCATLRGAGHEVIEAADGKDGLDQFDAHRPDIVISDLNMPICDGIEFTRAARQRSHSDSVPIIILTTESDPAIKAQGRKAGATAWMIKPFDPSTLLGLLDRLAVA